MAFRAFASGFGIVALAASSLCFAEDCPNLSGLYQFPNGSFFPLLYQPADPGLNQPKTMLVTQSGCKTLELVPDVSKPEKKLVVELDGNFRPNDLRSTEEPLFNEFVAGHTGRTALELENLEASPQTIATGPLRDVQKKVVYVSSLKVSLSVDRQTGELVETARSFDVTWSLEQGHGEVRGKPASR